MIRPGDKVAVPWMDKRSRKEGKRTGVVLAVYPRFVLVQLKHFRECFWYDEVEAVKCRRGAA